LLSVSERARPRLRWSFPSDGGTGRLRDVLSIAVVVAVLLTWPFVAANPYMLSAGVIVLNFAAFATGWNIMGGFTGYVSLGHVAFFGLGAYGTGLLIVDGGLPSFVAWLLAGVAVVLVALPVGYAALRVRGASFVIVTIALVLVLLLVFQSWRSVTGGSDGLIVPRPFPDLLRPEHHRVFYFLFLALLAAALLTWAFIDRSRFGAGLKAVREDEDKAESLGIPTGSLKLVAFAVSAFFVALSGGLYALWFGDLDPIFQFDVVLSAQIVLMALLGGTRSLFGPLLGAVVVGTALEFFLLNYGETQFHLVATGLLLGAVVMFLPEGVIPGLRQVLNRFRPQATSIRELTAEELRSQQDAARRGPASSGAGTREGTGPGAEKAVARGTEAEPQHHARAGHGSKEVVGDDRG
jgi:branched-chain amino acid transport system permease protein